MEKSKLIGVTLLLLLSTTAWPVDYKRTFYNAYINGNMAQWKTTLDQMELEKDKPNAFRLELVNYHYGYIGWCLSNKQKDEAEKHITLIEKHLTVLEKIGYRPATAHAYRSALCGFEIGLATYKAPFVGPKSIEHAENAMKTDPHDPQGYVQFANGLYFRPAAFGGSKTKAISLYLKALQLMEAQPDMLKNDWNYLSLLAIIGKAFYETGDADSAKRYFEKALNIEPNFRWVKNELYPAILKTQNG